MKALVLTGPGEIQLLEQEAPRLIEPTDAILKVTMSSICGSDIHVWHSTAARPRRILGHEFVGEIVDVGKEVSNFRVGDRVIAACTVQCGKCAECLRGRPVYCHNAMRYANHIDGAQAEYVRVPFADASLMAIPDALSYEDVIFVGDVLSTGYMGCLNGDIKPGDTVVVFGAGPVGLSAVATAKLFGPASIIAVDLLDYRLNKAKQLGADHVINASSEDVVEAVRSLTSGRGADVSIEAIGTSHTSVQPVSTAINCTSRGGNLSIVGLFNSPLEFPYHRAVHQGLTIRMGVVNVTNMQRLVDLILTKRIDMRPMITHRLPLENVVDGYKLFANKEDGCVKVVLEPKA